MKFKMNKRGGHLQVNHIKMYSKIVIEGNLTKESSIEEIYNCHDLWDVSNGRTLCIDCHKNTDTYRKRPTQECVSKEK